MAKTLYTKRNVKYRNWLINGDMNIAQRGTSFASIANGAYSLDRYIYYKVGAMVHTVSQDSDVPLISQTGYNFNNSMRLNLTTPDTAIASTDLAAISQRIEGLNYAQFAQRVFTLSFWVKATTPGTYCVAFQNSANDRSYVAEYTINTTATWEYKTITVAAPPSAGTWNYSTGIGLEVNWVLAAGSNFQQTAGSWQTNAGAKYATANQVNGVNTGATDFRITGAMLNEGPDAIPFRIFCEDVTDIQAAQRYYETSGTSTAWFHADVSNTGNYGVQVNFVTPKRAVPALTTGNFDTVVSHRGSSFDTSAPAQTQVTQYGFLIRKNCIATSGDRGWDVPWTASAEL